MPDPTQTGTGTGIPPERAPQQAPDNPPAPARPAAPEPPPPPAIARPPGDDEATRVIVPEDGALPPDDGTRTRVTTPRPAAAERTMIATGQPSVPPGLPPPMQTVLADLATPFPPPRSLPAAATRLVEPGTLINNNYRIEVLISAGGMGEVYRAVNVFTGDPVAVKVILPELARDGDIIDLFRREARVLVQLRDDAIVSYHNFILDQGLDRYCLIMEFVEGAHLGRRLRERQPMPEEEALRLFRRLAGGLRQAHARGVTHRDLSPDNVILRHDQVDEAVLIDFGIARSTELGDGLAGRFAGKFKYIAPEQLGHHDGQIGPQTDVYGLALLMVSVLRGQPLDMGSSVVTASAARQAIPDLSGLSHRVFPLLQHMLEPDPALRPANMDQVIAMLDDPVRIPARYRLPIWPSEATTPPPGAAATGVSESPFVSLPPADDPVAAPPPLAASRQSRKRAPLLIAGGLALLGAGAGWLGLRDPAPPLPVKAEAEPHPTGPTLPARDPASRDGFLATLDLGDCTMAQRITGGAAAGTIALFGPAPIDPARVQDAYERAFSARPAVTGHLVTEAQCPVVDFAATLDGRRALPTLVEPRAHATPTGFQFEARISGLADRNLWLALISPDGSVYDLTGQSARLADGTVRAGAAVDLPQPAAGGLGGYLLLAVTSSQPLVTIAAAPAGASAATTLPALLTELLGDGDAAAAALVPLDIAPDRAAPDAAPT